jgi:hypothetical protein
MKNLLIIISAFFFFLISQPLLAQQTPGRSGLDSLQFLEGSWAGKGTGDPGQSTGEFSFSFELQGKVLIRKSYAVYPATSDRPAFRHDDMMIVYRESGKPIRAVYFDNEGHVINYSVNFSDDRLSLVFLSDLTNSSPRFRLTYTKVNAETMNIKFEIAPPGKPEDFAVYLEAAAYKK